MLSPSSLKCNFIHLALVLAVQGLRCSAGFSPVAASGGCSLVVEQGALGHPGFSACGSWAPRHRFSSCAHVLSCSASCMIFPDQGSNPCLLHWQADSLPLSHLGSSSLRLAVPLTELKWIKLRHSLILATTTNPEDGLKSLNFKKQESCNADESNSVTSYLLAS